MNVEQSFITHLVNVDSLRKMIDENVSGRLFADELLGEMIDFSRSYFVNNDAAPTREVLEDEFSGWFAAPHRGWPDGEFPLPYLIDRLRDFYRIRELQDAFRKAAVMEEPEEAIRTAVSDLHQIQFHTSTQDRLEYYSERIVERVNNARDRAIHEGEWSPTNMGIPIGWPEVTNETWGIRLGELGVLAAEVKMGKSWAMCKFCLEAVRHGSRVYFATLENAKEMMMMRMDCLVSGVPFREYERGRLSSGQLRALREAQEEIASFADLLQVDHPKRAHERTVFELYARAKHHGAQLFVGDQLSHVTSEHHEREDWRQAGADIGDIMNMTRELNMASLWASQFNREAGRNMGGRGGLGQIARAHSIGATVDWAFGLSANKDQRADEHAVLEIIGTRRSRVMAWLMQWRLVDETHLAVERTIDL